MVAARNPTGPRGAYRSPEERAEESARVLAIVTEAYRVDPGLTFLEIARRHLHMPRARAWSAYVRALKLARAGQLPDAGDLPPAKRGRTGRPIRRLPRPSGRRWCSAGHVVPRSAIAAEADLCSSCRLGLPVWWPEAVVPLGITGETGLVNAVARGVEGQVMPFGHTLPSLGELGALARAAGLATIDRETATRRVER